MMDEILSPNGVPSYVQKRLEEERVRDAQESVPLSPSGVPSYVVQQRLANSDPEQDESSPERTYGQAASDIGQALKKGGSTVAKTPFELMAIQQSVAQNPSNEDTFGGRVSRLASGLSLPNLARTAEVGVRALGGELGTDLGDAFQRDRALADEYLGNDGKVLEGFDEFDKETEAKLSPQLIAERVEQQQQIAEAESTAEKFWLNIKSVFNPVTGPNILAEQAPMIAGMGAASRMARALGAGVKGQIATSAAVEGAIQGGSVSSQTYDDAVSQSEEMFAFNDRYVQLRSMGFNHEQAVERFGSELGAYAGLASGVVTTIVSNLPFANTIESSIAGAPIRALGEGALTRSLTGGAAGFVGEAGAEGVIEGFGRYAQNEAIRQIDPERSRTEGVSDAVAAGAAVGGVLGAGFGAYGGVANRPPSDDTPETPSRELTDDELADMEDGLEVDDDGPVDEYGISVSGSSAIESTRDLTTVGADENSNYRRQTPPGTLSDEDIAAAAPERESAPRTDQLQDSDFERVADDSLFESQSADLSSNNDINELTPEGVLTDAEIKTADEVIASVRGLYGENADASPDDFLKDMEALAGLTREARKTELQEPDAAPAEQEATPASDADFEAEVDAAANAETARREEFPEQVREELGRRRDTFGEFEPIVESSTLEDVPQSSPSDAFFTDEEIFGNDETREDDGDVGRQGDDQQQGGDSGQLPDPQDPNQRQREERTVSGSQGDAGSTGSDNVGQVSEGGSEREPVTRERQRQQPGSGRETRQLDGRDVKLARTIDQEERAEMYSTALELLNRPDIKTRADLNKALKDEYSADEYRYIVSNGIDRAAMRDADIGRRLDADAKRTQIEISRALKGIIKRSKDRVVSATRRELPQNMQDSLEYAGDDSQWLAMYDTETGQIFANPDAFESVDQLNGIIAHEAIHGGLRGAYPNEKTLDDALLKLMADIGDGAFARVFKALDIDPGYLGYYRDSDGAVDWAKITEEVLAHAREREVTNANTPLKRWLLILNDWLNKYGLKTPKLANVDLSSIEDIDIDPLVKMMRNAQRHYARSKGRGAGSNSSARAALMAIKQFPGDVKDKRKRIAETIVKTFDLPSSRYLENGMRIEMGQVEFDKLVANEPGIMQDILSEWHLREALAEETHLANAGIYAEAANAQVTPQAYQEFLVENFDFWKSVAYEDSRRKILMKLYTVHETVNAEAIEARQRQNVRDADERRMEEYRVYRDNPLAATVVQDIEAYAKENGIVFFDGVADIHADLADEIGDEGFRPGGMVREQLEDLARNIGPRIPGDRASSFDFFAAVGWKMDVEAARSHEPRMERGETSGNVTQIRPMFSIKHGITQKQAQFERDTVMRQLERELAEREATPDRTNQLLNPDAPLLAYDQQRRQVYLTSDANVIQRFLRNKMGRTFRQKLNYYFNQKGIAGREGILLKDSLKAARNGSDVDIEYLLRDLTRASREVPRADRKEALRAMDDYLKGDSAANIPEGTEPVLDAMRSYVDVLSLDIAGMLGEQIILLSESLSDQQWAEYQIALEDQTSDDDYEDFPDEFTRFSNQEGIPKSLMNLHKLQDTILNRVGSYLNRSYEAFVSKDWADRTMANRELIDRAVQIMQADRYRAWREAFEARASNEGWESFLVFEETEGQMGESPVSYDKMIKETAPEYIEAQIESMLEEARKNTDVVSMASSGASLGSRNLTILMRRKDLTPIVRELLGEYRDPAVNFTQSAKKMSNLLTSHDFLSNVYKQLKGTLIHDEMQRGYSFQIAQLGSKTLAPLNGKYTTREFGELMQAWVEPGDTPWPAFMWATGAVKMGLTVYNPGSHFANVYSNVNLMMVHGHLRPGVMAKTARLATVEMLGNSKYKSVHGLAEILAGRNSSVADIRAHRAKMIRFGVMLDGGRSGEMDAIRQDMETGSETIADWMDRTMIGRGVKSVVSSTLGTYSDIAQSAYRWEDDWPKMVAWEIEKERFMDEGMSEADAEVTAAEWVRNNYHTYSKVAEGVNVLRRSPVTGPFVAYTAQSLQITYNMLGEIKRDAKTNKPRAAYRLGRLALMSSVFPIVAEISQRMNDISDDDEEAIRQIVPKWSKHSTIIYTGLDDNGHMTYIDASRYDPWSYIRKIWNAASNGYQTKSGHRVLDAAIQSTDPFLSPEILASSLVFAALNARDGNKAVDVRNPESTPWQQTIDTAGYIAYSNAPGEIKSDIRMYKAIEGDSSPGGKEFKVIDELLGKIGIRKSTINLPQSAIIQGKIYKRRLDNARDMINSDIRDQNEISEKGLRESFSDMMSARDRAMDDTLRIIEAYRGFGMKDAAIENHLTAAGGMSKKDAKQLMRGKKPRYELSERVGQDSLTSALTAAGANDSGRRAELRKIHREKKRIINKLTREHYRELGQERRAERLAAEPRAVNQSE